MGKNPHKKQEKPPVEIFKDPGVLNFQIITDFKGK